MAVSGNWNDNPFRPARPGVNTATFGMGAEKLMCTINEIHMGHEMWPHTHPNEQIAIVLQGVCDYYVDGMPHRMTRGSWVVVPPEAEHYINVVDGSEPVLNMDIFSPPRQSSIDSYEEFLAGLPAEKKA